VTAAAPEGVATGTPWPAEPTAERLAVNVAYEAWRLLGQATHLAPPPGGFRAAHAWIRDAVDARLSAGPAAEPTGTVADAWADRLLQIVAGGERETLVPAAVLAEIEAQMRVLVEIVEQRRVAAGAGAPPAVG